MAFLEQELSELLDEALDANDLEAIQRIYDLINQEDEFFVENKNEWFFSALPAEVLDQLRL